MTTLVLEIADSRPVEARCGAQRLRIIPAGRRTPPSPHAIEFVPSGRHWPAIGEDISFAGMLRGEEAPGAHPL